MTIEYLNRAWKVDLRGNGGVKLLLVALADHADDNGFCFPGLVHLAVKTSTCVRTVQRYLRDLEKRKLIYRFRRCRGEGRGKGREKDAFILTIDPTGQPVTLVAPPLESLRPRRQIRPTNVTLVSRHIDEPTRTNINNQQQPSRQLGSKPARQNWKRSGAFQQSQVTAYLALARDLGDGDQDLGVLLLDSLPRAELECLVARRIRAPLDYETLQKIRAGPTAAPAICPA